MYISNLNTGDACIQQCKNADYRYAGTEFDHCFCGHTYKNYPQETGCTAPCFGNSNEKCGNHWRISLYDTWDEKYCDKEGFCPANWVCENENDGFFCRKP
ncbi:kremen protein 1-like [Ruditapes philippinarum]|uniref:kremen protein 1-like n=1 Tax=Ruditapes philippinarum TaxID=129788 RepID=UPI00295B0E9B|nr:kremen protein 1-like [Ruditapes philippinarum]